ncbi:MULTISPECIES: LysR family transcriptional regulator [Vibrio]|uniref:LysR family transcriptional regulator n=2 Tax=Vibrio TaxID=662 RepID=A0A7X4LKZ6_9VIBR|nr:MULTISPECIES: LysR family transcriptional regulator [Vibrio]MBF9000591.1 LysR family transcriptional regulator [Vibrio nitrifigilis]MZI93883.1 LysR family transcriptional regulator [Vibrio eleionomae]
MKALNDLYIFVETAKHGSFSKAAHAADVTPAAVSAAIKRLETQLDVALFIRSTRNLRLTHEGETLLEKASQALNTIQEGIDHISQTQGEIGGHIMLSAPSDFGRHLLLGWLEEFTDIYPHIQITLELSDGVSNLYNKPIDMAIRYGVPPDSRLVALPLCTRNRRIACATPSYLDKRPPISHPKDLIEHNCLCFQLASSTDNHWSFMRDGDSETITVSGHFNANDGEAVHQWALKGKGVIYKSLVDMSRDLFTQRLHPLLLDWKTEPCPLYVVCADRRLLNPTTKTLHEFLRLKCEKVLTEAEQYLTENYYSPK